MSISFWPALVTVTTFCILCKLGFWQLQRAQEKRELLQQFQQQEIIDISAVTDLKTTTRLEQFNGRQMTIKGEVLMPYVFYVDNKIHNGQVGYAVLAPVVSEGSSIAVMVNFGWVQAPESRELLPNLTLPQHIDFIGQLKSKHLTQFALKPDELSDNWPQRIQSAHSALNVDLKYKLLPAIVLAPSNTIASLPQTYKAVSMPPQKHQAYAVQWFLLAFASLVVFYFASIRQAKKESQHES